MVLPKCVATVVTLLLVNTLPVSPTLDIETCHGYINQRLSILYGLMLAHISNSPMYLPKLILNGRQYVEDSPFTFNTVPFGHFYDVNHFITTMRPHVHVLGTESNQPPTQYITQGNWSTLMAQSKWTDQLVQVSCPMFFLPAETLQKHTPLVEAWLRAFKPGLRFRSSLLTVRDRLQHGQYNFLHWRAEKDCALKC